MDERAAAISAALQQAMPPKYDARVIVGREMDELPQLLHDDEIPLKATSGTSASAGGHSVLAVATNERLLVFDRGKRRATMLEFAYADLRAVTYRTGWLAHGEVTVIPKTGPAVQLKNVPKHWVREFGDWLTSRIRSAAASPSAPPTATPSDTITLLSKVADLHKAGILTDEEFAAKKKQLLEL